MGGDALTVATGLAATVDSGFVGRSARGTGAHPASTHPAKRARTGHPNLIRGSYTPRSKSSREPGETALLWDSVADPRGRLPFALRAVAGALMECGACRVAAGLIDRWARPEAERSDHGRALAARAGWLRDRHAVGRLRG